MWRALTVVFALMLTALVIADGKMFGSASANLEQPGIRHQRAVLSWHDGEQTLIIENVVKNREEAAWLLPVPGKPSQVEALPEGYFTFLSSKYHIRLFTSGGTIFFAVFLFLVLLMGSFVEFREGRFRYLLTMIFLLAIALLVGTIIFPVFAGSSIMPTGQFSETSVADYKVTVIAPKDTTAGVAWLRKGGFAVSLDEEEALRGYAREGWYFVAARLKPEADLSRPHPLMIRCPSAKPVYPMALTGLQGGPLNLELYVVGKKPSRVDGMRVVKSWRGIFSWDNEKARVFPNGSVVTLLTKRFDLSAKTEDIQPTGDGDFGQETVFWTKSGKLWGVVERLCFAVSFALVFVAPWFYKKDSRKRGVLIAIGVGIFGGLAWSAPMFFEPTVETGTGRVHRFTAMSGASVARKTAGAVMASHHKSEAITVAGIGDPVRAKFKSIENRFVLYEFTDKGMKVVTIDATGEPLIQSKTWRYSKIRAD